MRKQSVGSNTNTWGDAKLNDNLDNIDRAANGYQSIAMSGDTTLSATNYLSTNDGKVKNLKLTGALTSAANLVVYTVEWSWDSITNSTGVTVTVKTAAGTGVAIPNGYKAQVYCDGVNCVSGSSQLISGDVTTTGALTLGGALTVAGQVHTVTAGTAGTDAVNVTQLAAAIAASVPAGTAGTLKVSVTDSTNGFLAAKVTSNYTGLTTTQLAGLTTVQISTVNGGANEQVLLTGVSFVGGFKDGGLQTSQFTPAVGFAYDVDCSSAGVTVNLAGMTTPQVGQEIKLNKFGTAGNMFLLGTINGGTNLASGAPNVNIFRYCGSSWGWN